MSELKVNKNDIYILFYALKVSIDSMANQSTDTKMKEVLDNCKKLELFLKEDYLELWRMERNERMQAHLCHESVDSMPGLVPNQRRESVDSMPGLVPNQCRESVDSMPGLVPNQRHESFDSMPGLVPLYDHSKSVDIPVNQHLFFDDNGKEVSVIKAKQEEDNVIVDEYKVSKFPNLQSLPKYSKIYKYIIRKSFDNKEKEEELSDISIICEDGPPLCTPVRNTVIREPPKIKRNGFTYGHSCDSCLY